MAGINLSINIGVPESPKKNRLSKTLRKKKDEKEVIETPKVAIPPKPDTGIKKMLGALGNMQKGISDSIVKMQDRSENFLTTTLKKRRSSPKPKVIKQTIVKEAKNESPGIIRELKRLRSEVTRPRGGTEMMG